MNTNFEELEDIFADTSIQKKVESHINKDLLQQYLSDPALLERDIKEGILPEYVANEYRNAVYAYPNIESESYELESGETKGKQKVKRNGNARLHSNLDLGYAEPMLLSIVISLIGLLYLCCLYLVV